MFIFCGGKLTGLVFPEGSDVKEQREERECFVQWFNGFSAFRLAEKGEREC